MTITKYYKNSFICVCAYMSVYMSMCVCRDRLVYIYRQEEVMGDLLYHLGPFFPIQDLSLNLGFMFS